MKFREVDCEDKRWMELTSDCVHWQAFGICCVKIPACISCLPHLIYDRTWLHGISYIAKYVCCLEPTTPFITQGSRLALSNEHN
jgi:hypothetical protein